MHVNRRKVLSKVKIWEAGWETSGSEVVAWTKKTELARGRGDE